MQAQENTMQPVPSLDHDYLRENYLAVGFGMVLKEALQVYCEQNRILLKQLRTALDRENMGEVMQLAHTIKGSSSSVGAKAMELLAQSLEEAGEQVALPSAAHMVTALENETVRTEKAIAEKLQLLH